MTAKPERLQSLTDAILTGCLPLSIDIYQTGISMPAGTSVSSTFTINGVGAPGPSTLSDFYNGTLTPSPTLGTALEAATFPAIATGDSGRLTNSIGQAITADAEQYTITFTAPNQSVTDTRGRLQTLFTDGCRA